MLTRAAVAKRLGRSIATVRRLEGTQLHPWTDARGIHRFDATEVDRLATRVDDDGLAASEFLTMAEDTTETREALDAANERVERLKQQLAAMESDRDVATRRARQREDEARKLRKTAIEALELVQVLLEADTPYDVRSCLRDLKRAG